MWKVLPLGSLSAGSFCHATMHTGGGGASCVFQEGPCVKAPCVRASSYSFSFLEKHAAVYVKASGMLNHACNPNVLNPICKKLLHIDCSYTQDM